MADSLWVVLKKDAMLQGDAWQANIAAHGFALTIDTNFDPFAFAGQLPCVYRKKKSGFSYFSGPLSDVDWEDAEAPHDFGDRDFHVNLEIRGGEASYLAAVAAAAVLSRETGGILVETDGTTVVTAAEALDWARATVARIEADAEAAKAAKKYVKTLEKNPELARAELAKEVAGFIGSKAVRAMAHGSRLYIHYDGAHGKRALLLDGWRLTKDGTVEMTARKLALMATADPPSYQRFLEQDLTAKAEVEIADASVSAGNALRVEFVTGYALEVDHASADGTLFSPSEWRVKVGRVEIRVTPLGKVSVSGA